MQTAFDGIKSLGCNTLGLDKELIETWDMPGVNKDSVRSARNRKQVNQHNVIAFMGNIEESISALLIETGHQYNLNSN